MSVALGVGCAGNGGSGDCSDGADNDADGLIDDNDPGCIVNGDTEAPDPNFPACNDAVDNDGDGLIDTEDPGCDDINDPDEYNEPIAQCRDGIDNDGDGRIDYPNDPGCSISLEDDELDDCPDGPNCPPCSNGIDDDGDGVSDYPDDLGCSASADNDEFNADPSICGAAVPLTLLPADGVATGIVVAGGANDLISPECGGSGTEHAWQFEVTEPTAMEFTTDFPETTLDTVIYVREECRMTSTELGCNDDSGLGVSTLFLDRLEPGEYFVIVDAFNIQSAGDFKLQVTGFTPSGEACSPAANDCAPDLVCRFLDSSAPNETCELPECSDGLNNEDGDGFTDFPDDPGCADPTDNDEADNCPGGAGCPQCGNNADDDSDGLIDFPNDPGCFFAADNNEIDECIPGVEVIPLSFGVTTGTTAGTSNFDPTCSFGGSSPEDIHAMILNRDLLSITFSTAGSTIDTITSVRLDTCDDAGAEIACADPAGGGETVTLSNPAQGNYFVFVDGNFATGNYTLETTGVIPGGDACDPADSFLICQSGFFCNGATSTCEVADCNDTVDNDSDGDTDWPNDPGCDTPSDNDETDNCPSGAGCPACSNLQDDDADGFIDFGSDMGCAFAADDNELDCDGETDPVELITAASTTGTTVGLTNDFTGSCGGNGPEAVHVLQVPGVLTTLQIDTIGSDLDSVVYVKPTDCASAELACDDEGGPAFGESLVTLDNVQPGQYMVFVDTFSTAEPYVLNVKGTIQAGETCDPAQVASGMMECESGFFCDGSSCVVAACNDTNDNDSDGKTDFPNDPGCATPSDNDESDNCPGGAGCPECGNNSDDDGDGQTDFPNDPGCEAASDNLELDPCVTGVPIELLTDAGVTGTTPPSGSGSNFEGSCSFSTTATEDVYAYDNTRVLETLTFSTVGSAGDTVLYARQGGMCSDTNTEKDCTNDQNGGETITIASPAQDLFYVFVDGDFVSGIDYVLDVSGTIAQGQSCSAADTQFVCGAGLVCGGGNTCVPTQCNDGMDNDSDGDTDDFDPGCSSSSDNSEAPDPSPLPECADGNDNDSDGFTDYPMDVGCSNAADDLELNCDDQDPIVTVTGTPTTGSTSGASNDFVPSCSTSSTAPDIVHQISFPGALDSLVVDTQGSSYDTTLYVKTPTCLDADIACNDDTGGLQSEVTVNNAAAGLYFIVVDGFSSNSGAYTLNIDAIVSAGEACDPAQISAGIATCGGGTTCTSGICQ